MKRIKAPWTELTKTTSWLPIMIPSRTSLSTQHWSNLLKILRTKLRRDFSTRDFTLKWSQSTRSSPITPRSFSTCSSVSRSWARLWMKSHHLGKCSSQFFTKFSNRWSRILLKKHWQRKKFIKRRIAPNHRLTSICVSSKRVWSLSFTKHLWPL